MEELCCGEMLGWEYLHIQQSNTVMNGNSPHMRFIIPRYGNRWIIYQSTRGQNIEMKYWEMEEICCGEILGWDYLHI